MDRLNKYGLCTDIVHRLRYARGLIEQAEVDYRELTRLSEKVKSGHATGDEAQELIKLLSWLKQELGALRELEGIEIEKVACAQIGQIEDNIRAFSPRNSCFWADRRSILDLL
jgi:hypothetical protein